MKIAVVANLKEDAPLNPEDPPGQWDDLDESCTVQAILDALYTAGHVAAYFPAQANRMGDLIEFQPDIVFNIAEGHYGVSREAQFPALLDMHRIPYTGAGVLGMSLSHNKHTAKRAFRFAGLPTADSIIVTDPAEIPAHTLRYPLFVKPAHEGSSIGINEHAVVWTPAELDAQVRWVYAQVYSPVLVEEYIEGREFTVGVLGDAPLPVVEIVSPTGFYNNAQKEAAISDVYRVCPANISPELTAQLQQLALDAMQALELSDVCRMDVRVDRSGQPYILEVNPLPLMNPDPEQASLVYAARAAGLSYAQMVDRILYSAVRRLHLDHLLVPQPVVPATVLLWHKSARPV